MDNAAGWVPAVSGAVALAAALALGFFILLDCPGDDGE